MPKVLEKPWSDTQMTVTDLKNCLQTAVFHKSSFHNTYLLDLTGCNI